MVLDIFDNEIIPRAMTFGETFNLADCSSLLFRLEMDGKFLFCIVMSITCINTSLLLSEKKVFYNILSLTIY